MDQRKWEEAAECLRLLAHPHRLQAIHMLLENECSVGEIATACNILPNVASEHLTLMKNKQLIRAERRGKKVYYTIQEPALASIISCVKQRFFKQEKS